MRLSSNRSLVVVESTGLRTAIRRAVGSDFDVDTFSSVEVARTGAHWERVAAVLADVSTLAHGQRPTESRLRDAIGELRSAARWGELPVILTSDDEAPTAHAAALAAGADIFISHSTAEHPGILTRYIFRLVGEKGQIAPVAGHAAPVTNDPPRASDVFDLPTGRFRNGSGRFHAGFIANALGVPLKRLASAIDVPYTTIHKTPDSEALERRLSPFANVLAMLDQAYQGDEARVRAWLRSEQPALGGRTPLDVLLEPGGIVGVEQFVTAAWMGEPD